MDLSNNIEEFVEFGVTVVEDVFSNDEVTELRNQLHSQLLEFGIDHSKILNGEFDTKNSNKY